VRTNLIVFGYSAPVHIDMRCAHLGDDCVHPVRLNGHDAYWYLKDILEIGASNPRAKKRRRETLREVFDLFPLLEERQAQLAGTLSGTGAELLWNPHLRETYLGI
jgi:hypothetical protein